MKINVFEIGGYRTAPTAAMTPSANPATIDPRIEPRPPMTTIANVLMMIESPMLGATFVFGAASTPANAASAAPNANVPLTRRLVLMPNARVSSGFSVAARIRAPSRERSIPT